MHMSEVAYVSEQDDGGGNQKGNSTAIDVDMGEDPRMTRCVSTIQLLQTSNLYSYYSLTP